MCDVMADMQAKKRIQKIKREYKRMKTKGGDFKELRKIKANISVF